MATNRTYQLMGKLGQRALNANQKNTINAGLNTKVFEPDPIEQRKSFQPGVGNKAMQGLNKTIGEKVSGVKGQPLIDQDWLAGGGKTLGKLANAFGAPETGAMLSNSGYLSGNPLQFTGQAFSDMGAKELGSQLMSLSGANTAGAASSAAGSAASSAGGSSAGEFLLKKVLSLFL